MYEHWTVNHTGWAGAVENERNGCKCTLCTVAALLHCVIHVHVLCACIVSCRKTKRRSVHWEFIDGTRHRTLLHVLFIHSSNKFLPDYYDATFSVHHLRSFVRSLTIHAHNFRHVFAIQIFHTPFIYCISRFRFDSFCVATSKIIWVPDLSINVLLLIFPIYYLLPFLVGCSFCSVAQIQFLLAILCSQNFRTQNIRFLLLLLLVVMVLGEKLKKISNVISFCSSDKRVNNIEWMRHLSKGWQRQKNRRNEESYMQRKSKSEKTYRKWESAHKAHLDSWICNLIRLIIHLWESMERNCTWKSSNFCDLIIDFLIFSVSVSFYPCLPVCL